MARRLKDDFDPKKALRDIKRLLKLHDELYMGPLVGVLLGSIHIDEEYLTQFAPLEQWSLKLRNTDYCPVEASTTVDGLHMFAIMTYEQCRELFGIDMREEIKKDVQI